MYIAGVTLPVEVLQLIAGYLPTTSVVKLMKTCRTANTACDDWKVWRAVVKRNPAFLDTFDDLTIKPADDLESDNPDTLNDGKLASWKLYAMADKKGASGVLDSECADWLPHLMARRHSFTETIDLRSLSEFLSPATPTFPSWVPSEQMDDLRKEQERLNFCLAAPLISNRFLDVSNLHGERPLLHELHRLFQGSMYTVGESSSLTHFCTRDFAATAYLTIGLLYSKLYTFWRFQFRPRSPLEDGTLETLEDNIKLRCHILGVSLPPKVWTLPFSSFMDIPTPFKSHPVTEFGKCHLRTMATPEFLADGPWTGYITTYLREGYDGIGGNHPEVDRLGGMNFGVPIDRFCNFNCIGRETIHGFRMGSNHFHGQLPDSFDLSMTMDVDTKTGILGVIHSTGPHAGQLMCGIISPFGLLIDGPVAGGWMWLWKTAWSSEI